MSKLFFLLLVLLLPFISPGQRGQYISYRQTNERLFNKKKSVSTTTHYYDKGKNVITKHTFEPEEIVTVTNELGEIKIYYPQTNKVTYQHIKGVSSKSNLIYYFANNQTDHLGLADEGFQLIDRSYDQNYLVTTWQAPSNKQRIDKVKMVFEMGNPIYAEYLDAKEAVLQKIYYTGYQDYFTFRMPMRIIEINYMPKGDSIVNRTIFSNIEVADTPESDYFNFIVPDDAEPIETK